MLDLLYAVAEKLSSITEISPSIEKMATNEKTTIRCWIEVQEASNLLRKNVQGKVQQNLLCKKFGKNCIRNAPKSFLRIVNYVASKYIRKPPVYRHVAIMRTNFVLQDKKTEKISKKIRVRRFSQRHVAIKNETAGDSHVLP